MRASNISTIIVAVVLVLQAFDTSASTDTNGPNGINSAGLLDANGQPLTGGGVIVGQVEPGRPGDPDLDDPAHSNVTINPADVFIQDGDATMNDSTIDEHAEGVAGVMISTDGVRTGVAPGAALYSSATNMLTSPGQREAALSAQHIVSETTGGVRAINFSFGEQLVDDDILDGNSLLTQFVDWSASYHDVLYAIAGNEGGGAYPVPTENFNGLTVAFSKKVGSVYRQVDSRNLFTPSVDAVGARTSVSLLAPGDTVEVQQTGGGTGTIDGTSMAAPHVTGTVALLQQYASQKIAAGAPQWDEERARRHEVMKAVLMNSADKLKDDGTFAPVGRLLGMERTVLKKDGTSTWFDSAAYDDDTATDVGFIPLDEEMGTGHLNASRALTQFKTGEFNPDGPNVPVVGWDYGRTIGEDDDNRYVFDRQLLGDSFVSITLAFDRVVNFAVDEGMQGVYDDPDDMFEPYMETDPYADDVINDLDLYLLPKGSFNIGQAIAQSISFDSTVDHIFFQIPETGEYEFWVHQHDADVPGLQHYGVAWWAVGTGSSIGADLDDDGDVDGRDIDILWSIVRETGTDPNDDDNPDLNGDELVNEDDVDFMLAGLLDAGGNRAYGDANLSGGTPELTDYNLWRTGTGGWANGDFDGSGGVPELNDYNLWRTGPTQFPGSVGSHGPGAPGAGAPLVPEPATIVLMDLALPAMVLAARRNKKCRE